MTEATREPLVPADVDLRGYEFMPLYGDRLMGSETWLSCSADAKIAALRLWWRAYGHELPAGSLPDNDNLLAEYAGYGVAVKAWRKVKEQAMRGWFKCADGRWYHKFLAELVLVAWEKRVEEITRATNEANRKRLEREARSQMFEQLRAVNVTPEWNTKTTELRRLVSVHVTQQSQGQPPKVTRTDNQSHADKDGLVTAKTGQDRTGQDNINPKPETPAEQRLPDGGGGTPDERAQTEAKATMRGAMAKALRDEGVTITPSHPQLVAWHDAGVTIQILREAVDIARVNKPKPEPIPPGYLAPIVQRLLTPVQPVIPGKKADWWTHGDGIKAKAEEMQISIEKINGAPDGVHYTRLRCAIAAKIGMGPWVDPRNATEMRIYDEFVKELSA